MKPEKFVLMLADDDPDDREFIQDAFRESGFTGEFRVVENGEELIGCLQNQGRIGEPGNWHPPSLILLDLNMPKLDGYEVLNHIKADPQLKQIPIIVLSTSESREDIARTYGLGVNSFITKPSSFDALVKMARAINGYWLNLVKLPDLT